MACSAQVHAELHDLASISRAARRGAVRAGVRAGWVW
jgi:hypothetical protein